MRRSYVLLCLLLLFGFISCQKSDNTGAISSAYFTVDGIHDLRMQSQGGYTSSQALSLTVTNTGAFQQTVSLSVKGLPDGMYLDTSGTYYNGLILTGIPTFNTQLIFTDVSAQPGTYTVSLICTGSATGDKVYNFNIIVLPPPDCTPTIVGSYSNCNFYCLSSTYADNITKSPSVPDRVVFHNFMNTGHEVYADLQCNSNTLSIPYQSFSNGDSFYGNGNFSASGISFYSVTAHIGGSTQSCSGNYYK